MAHVDNILRVLNKYIVTLTEPKEAARVYLGSDLVQFLHLLLQSLQRISCRRVNDRLEARGLEARDLEGVGNGAALHAHQPAAACCQEEGLGVIDRS